MDLGDGVHVTAGVGIPIGGGGFRVGAVDLVDLDAGGLQLHQYATARLRPYRRESGKDTLDP